MIIEDLETKMQRQESHLQELTEKTENLNRDIQELLAELQVSPEQLTAFLKDKNNFNEANWQTIVEQQQQLAANLERALANIPNPRKNKQTYSKRVIPPNWLYVR